MRLHWHDRDRRVEVGMVVQVEGHRCRRMVKMAKNDQSIGHHCLMLLMNELDLAIDLIWYLLQDGRMRYWLNVQMLDMLPR